LRAAENPTDLAGHDLPGELPADRLARGGTPLERRRRRSHDRRHRTNGRSGDLAATKDPGENSGAMDEMRQQLLQGATVTRRQSLHRRGADIRLGFGLRPGL
jgi:hypothetical protein